MSWRPARVFDSQEALQAAFKTGELERDVVVVVRFQGPRANGMPELHKLTPPLAVLQGRASRSRWSPTAHERCSGKVPAAIHVSPRRSPAARWRCCATATGCAWTASPARCMRWSTPPWAPAPCEDDPAEARGHAHGLGRDLFAGMRRHVRPPPGRRDHLALKLKTIPVKRDGWPWPTAGPVIPVIVLERVADAVPLARALVAGGVKCWR